MNILQLSKHMDDSGVNSHIIQLSRMLTLEGHRVIVLSSGGPHTIELEEMNIEHFKIPFMSKNPFVQLMNLFLLIRLIYIERIDIAHTHWRSTGIYLKLASIFTGVDFIWTNHSNNIPSGWLYKVFTFSGKATLTVASDMLPMLHKRLGISKKKLHVVFNGVDSEQYIQYSCQKKQELKELYKVGNQKVICLLGRLAPVKGHLYFLDALGEMMKNNVNIAQYKVLFTGNGSDQYKDAIIQKAKNYGLIDSIVFTGYVNPVDILNISDVMVLPSENEGFGIVCIEAFAMGVPVIRTKTGGYSDMKDFCIGVEYGDTETLSNALLEVLSNEVRTKEMVNMASRFYEQKLTAKKMGEEVLKIYKN